jgi:Ca-activated chloride channel family protein
MRLLCCLLVCCSLCAVEGGLYRLGEDGAQPCDQAKAAGSQAALLDQERPNIFTQSIANVPAASTVEIEIAFTDELPLRDGVYRFHLPLSIGPRYMPADGSVNDADRIPQELDGPNGHGRFGIHASIDVFGAVPIASIGTPSPPRPSMTNIIT